MGGTPRYKHWHTGTSVFLTLCVLISWVWVTVPLQHCSHGPAHTPRDPRTWCCQQWQCPANPAKKAKTRAFQSLVSCFWRAVLCALYAVRMLCAEHQVLSVILRWSTRRISKTKQTKQSQLNVRCPCMINKLIPHFHLRFPLLPTPERAVLPAQRQHRWNSHVHAWAEGWVHNAICGF